jgi:hypothetical protein
MNAPLEQQLMQKIKVQYSAAIAIEARLCAIPESFLAALIANETGGDPNAKRFEKSVCGAVFEVLVGRKAAYGSLTTADFLRFVSEPTTTAVTTESDRAAITIHRVGSLCTSHGITQVMGYQALCWPGILAVPEDLEDTGKCLRVSIGMLNSFAHRWQIDERREFAKLFHCWNTGQPDGDTFDPNYVPRGLARMSIYEGSA